jgi:hypothetical protein
VANQGHRKKVSAERSGNQKSNQLIKKSARNQCPENRGERNHERLHFVCQNQMQEYCLPLELIAFAIHPGSTESTTTVCLDVSSSCLYLTSQSNLKFANVTREMIHGLIEYLASAKIDLTSKLKTAATCADEYWEDHCALSTKNVFISKKSKKSFEGKSKKIRAQHVELWKNFRDAENNYEQVDRLKRMITSVESIEDDDIFVGHAPEKTGFHGESRIIRFLFIRDYPELYAAANNGEFPEAPRESALPSEIKENASQLFRNAIKSRQIAMGSSQATCEGCGDYLDKLNIAHGKTGHRSPQWLNPLTMCGKQGGMRIDKPDRLHAIFKAFPSWSWSYQ